MRKKLVSVIFALLMIFATGTVANAAITEADAKYAQAAGKATQGFSTAIGNWGDTYQQAPNKVNSPEYKSWIKRALAADNAVKTALNEFSKIKVSSGYKKSDVTLRKFVKAYTNAINQYAPAIKKNDQKLVKKANDSILAATSLFTAWGTEFAQESSRLAQ
jgi:type II secretory pathway pseudopilin PulG